MNIEALAAQAGPLISTPFGKWCENFAHLIREAVVQERIAELEAALDVALEALEKSMYPQKAQLDAIAKLKEVRRD